MGKNALKQPILLIIMKGLFNKAPLLVKGALTLAPFAPLALIGGWKYQGASGGIVYKITAAFRSDLSLFLQPVVISLSKESLVSQALS